MNDSTPKSYHIKPGCFSVGYGTFIIYFPFFQSIVLGRKKNRFSQDEFQALLLPLLPKLSRLLCQKWVYVYLECYALAQFPKD